AGFEARAGVEVPRVLAEDPDGAVDGVPALLQTRLRGRPRSRTTPLPVAAVRRLAETLVAINDLEAGLRALVVDYAPFAEVESVRPPAATNRPVLWARALEVAAAEPPSRPGTFMHRDFHPGNALWEGNRLTGILDWTQASWGPPAADLGHLRVNLAADHSVELADVATEAYLAAGGRLEDAPYWDIRTLLDWLPDLDDAYASGPGLERLERYLAALLGVA
ncbi:MAG TPA: aminoglycoside phosphotransferase family protein, partial [Candidatus Limnocylindrales bacterium]|nr:aminoglycoside phosphotransferase family protein [Candidatus Limnocylindrales bacterium]